MIICLGWGSLIWNTDPLVISGDWQKDGPTIPVEFLRQSKDGQLTLIIEPGFPETTVLWAKMKTNDLGVARENLRQREGWPKKEYIGNWRQDSESPADIPSLANWSKQIGATAVIWTALPAKFNDEDFRKPTVDEAIAYLEKLEPSKRALAEEYVRRTPLQISTRYRSSFEEHFGWVHKCAT